MNDIGITSSVLRIDCICDVGSIVILDNVLFLVIAAQKYIKKKREGIICNKWQAFIIDSIGNSFSLLRDKKWVFKYNSVVLVWYDAFTVVKLLG